MRKTATLLLATQLALLAYPSAADECHLETLRSVVQQQGLSLPGQFELLANKRTSNYSILRDDEGFLYAGYLMDDCRTDSTLGELHLLQLNVAEKSWRYKSSSVARGGSVVAAQKSAGHYLLTLHASPSRNFTHIFNQQLNLERIINGWPLALLGGGRVIFQEGMVHFAPTHSAVVGLYDINTDVSNTILPAKKDTALHARLAGYYQQAYGRLGEDWCRNNNHHCNPRQLDSSVWHQVTAPDTDEILGLLISYKVIGGRAWIELTGESKVPVIAALYIIRLQGGSKSAIEEYPIQCINPDLNHPNLPLWMAEMLAGKSSVSAAKALVCSTDGMELSAVLDRAGIDVP